MQVPDDQMTRRERQEDGQGEDRVLTEGTGYERETQKKRESSSKMRSNGTVTFW
jgi:hypothetical protein